MPLLARSLSVPSVHSWWSHSNTPGATISLHAAAKPLIKYLYLRQAREFIKTRHSAPLTSETMEVLTSYLAYKYTSAATKILVLKEITRRVRDLTDAHIVAGVLGEQAAVVLELLQSPISALPRQTCELMRCLILEESLTCYSDPLRVVVCESICSLLRPDNIDVCRSAISALSSITLSITGSVAAIDANILDRFTLLHENEEWIQDAIIQECLCRVLANMAKFESTISAVIAAKPWSHLVTLLGMPKPFSASAIHALRTLTLTSDGAIAVVDAGILPVALKLWHASEEPTFEDSIINLLGCLAKHHSHSVRDAFVNYFSDDAQVTKPGESPSGPWKQWYLCNARCLQKLATRAEDFEHARTVLDAVAGDRGIFHALLFEEVSPIVKQITCLKIGTLAKDQSTSVSELALTSCDSLVQLLRHPGDITVSQYALYALSTLGCSSKGAKTIVATKHWDPATALHSNNEHILYWACALLEALSKHVDVSSFGVCQQLVFLLSYTSEGESLIPATLPMLPDKKSLLETVTEGDVRQAALTALTKVCTWTKGAEAAVDAGIVQCVVKLLRQHGGNLNLLCTLLGRLVWHKSTAQAVVSLKPCFHLSKLLRNGDVSASVMSALSRITQWEAGAQDLAQLPERNRADICALKLSDTATRVYTCVTMWNMAMYKLPLGPGSIKDPCAELAKLLQDPKMNVREAAMYGFVRISRDPQGAQAVRASLTPAHIQEILESSQDWAHKLRLNLCKYQLL